MENLVLIRLVERYMFEGDLSLNGRQNHGILRILNGGLFFIKLLDAAVGCHGIGKRVCKPAEHFHRPYNVIGICKECS